MLKKSENLAQRTSQSVGHSIQCSSAICDRRIIDSEPVDSIRCGEDETNALICDRITAKPYDSNSHLHTKQSKPISTRSRIRERLKDFKRFGNINLSKNRNLWKNLQNKSKDQVQVNNISAYQKNNNNNGGLSAASTPKSSRLLLPSNKQTKDNNYVRIHVSYDNNNDDYVDIDSVYNRIGTSENNREGGQFNVNSCGGGSVITIEDSLARCDFNHEDDDYNENAIDCPLDFLEQQQQNYKLKFNDYKDTIRDFLREDWIGTDTTGHGGTSFSSAQDTQNFRQHSAATVQSNGKQSLTDNLNKSIRKMGTVCSTRLKNHVLPSHDDDTSAKQTHKKLSKHSNGIIQVVGTQLDKTSATDRLKLPQKSEQLSDNESDSRLSNANSIKVTKTKSSFTQTDSPERRVGSGQVADKITNTLNNESNLNEIKKQQQLEAQRQIEQQRAIELYLQNDSDAVQSIELNNILHRGPRTPNNSSKMDNLTAADDKDNKSRTTSLMSNKIDYSNRKYSGNSNHSNHSMSCNSIRMSDDTTTTARGRDTSAKRNSEPNTIVRNSAASSIASGRLNGNDKTFFQSLSGSVQNLVYGSNRATSYGKLVRNKSFSENNLTKLFHKKFQKNNSNKTKSSRNNYYSSASGIVGGGGSDSDYCPSVLYNRKQIAEQQRRASKESRQLNLKNFKQMLTTNLPGLSRKHHLHRSKSIQDTDGGFFEKFGSLLRHKSINDDHHIETQLAPLREDPFENEGKEGGDGEETEEIKMKMFSINSRSLPMENENDSGISEGAQDSDSDIDDEAKKAEIIEAFDMNTEELYEEVLHEILHNIGCETSDEVCQSSLLEFVQDAFKMTNDVHERILKMAETKEPPEIRLNVEIIKAENLIPKDSNGLSDPFVTMYLESCSTHRYNTSVKSGTLAPIWEEHFSLPIPENPNYEVLVLEVWDFDAAETVGEKMNKVFEVKGIRGFRKLMKEIAVTASTGKHDNELIGRTSIPLRCIPASGIKVWYSLEKNGKAVKNRGSVLIHMSFSAEKNNRVAAQEHRHLLKVLLMHELESSKVAQYWWSGKFNAQAQAVITQHSAQSGLTATDCAMAEWSVYAQINQKHHLSFTLFNQLLDKILPTLQTLPNDDDEVKLFWEGARRLLPSCFAIVRKLRQKTFGDKTGLKILNEVLSIMSKIAMLEPPPETDLLPKNIYGWIVRDPHDSSPNWDLRGALRDSVNAGAFEWFERIKEGSSCAKDNEEDQLQHLIKLCQLVRTDLQQAIEFYDRIFKQKMHFNYAQTLYLFYEGKLAESCQPIVEDVCKNFKRLHLSEDRWEKLPENEDINMGTTLFELYLALKRFTTLGGVLCPGQDNLTIYKYHEWFTIGVSHWLDISVYKALIRIEKAIDLDKLKPVDETVKYSSSAVDTLAIFYQIKIFWQQLGWPDAEGAYIFVSKIVDDICRCCVFYADRMSKRVEEIDLHENKDRFEVTQEWCLAINNIDYIRQSLTPFIKELGADEIIVKLGEFRSDVEAQRCSQTIKNVIENAIDTERNKIIELIEEVARKMSPAMRRFLTEGAEVLHEDSNSMDRLMMYLENALATLHAELNEVNFERILESIWCEISVILYELVQTNLEKRRPPSFFSNLRGTLHVMVNSFKLSDSKCCSDKETLENIERLLELHAFETAELIHQYYLVRLQDQRNMKEYPYGQLTVRGHFVGNSLHLEIMNARNLVPMDSDGLCDSFVKVHFMPTDKFLGVATPKTSTQSKTLYPLYEEKFTIVLSDEQRKMSQAIMVFSIKDKDYFGMSNQYIAEAYLTFGDIESTPDEQLHLSLSRPEYKDTDCLKALEHRQGDKQARDFLKKLKQKAY